LQKLQAGHNPQTIRALYRFAVDLMHSVDEIEQGLTDTVFASKKAHELTAFCEQALGVFFEEYNHILTPLLAATVQLSHSLSALSAVERTPSAILDFHSTDQKLYYKSCLNEATSKELFFAYYPPTQKADVVAMMNYVVAREVDKKMKEEAAIDDIESLTYRLPFKMKVQKIVR